nr:hypothetical protein [Hymenobacter sp. AT01-02]
MVAFSLHWPPKAASWCVRLLVSFLLLSARLVFAQSLTSHVDPLIGTGGHGHVFLGANVPFGAVQVGPQNIFKGWDWCSGYHYSDSLITGFSHTHLSGTGASDLGDVLIMPYTGAVQTDKGRQQAPHQAICHASLTSAKRPSPATTP